MITDNFFPGMLDDDDAPRQAAGFDPRPLYRSTTSMTKVSDAHRETTPQAHPCMHALHAFNVKGGVLVRALAMPAR